MLKRRFGFDAPKIVFSFHVISAFISIFISIFVTKYE